MDGIYLNEESNTIEVYQSKISQKKKSSIGDTALKEFEGTLKQFATTQSVADLITSAGKADVAKLLQRLDIANKISHFEVKGIFISNIDLDQNGIDYLKSHSDIRFVGQSELSSTFIANTRDERIAKPMSFDVSGHDVAEYQADRDHKAMIAPLKASELIKLDGITNQALYAYNVRGPLGRTQVNRDIAESIQTPSRHKFFPLFHNGITIIAKTLTSTKDKITIDQYYVVNGCQSLSELHGNASHITGDLRVLVKIIKMDASSPLADTVTSFSNNQNGVKARDFKSNNPIQIRLQNEFKTEFGNEYFYEIKRGEDNRNIPVITNEQAGLYLMAFDLKKPWATHRKYQIFEDEYAEIFGRPAANASRIVLCHLLVQLAQTAIGKLSNSLFAKYALTKYFLLYTLRLILDGDAVGQNVVGNPKDYISNLAHRRALLESIDTILSDVVIDLNAELQKLGDDFDYRGKLRDEAWVKNLAHEIVASYQKLVVRQRIKSLSQEYDENLKISVRKKTASKKKR